MRRAQECVLALALLVTGRAQKDAEAPNATVIGDVTFRKLSENRGKSLTTRTGKGRDGADEDLSPEEEAVHNE
jgi:hypothetical protein